METDFLSPWRNTTSVRPYVCILPAGDRGGARSERASVCRSTYARSLHSISGHLSAVELIKYALGNGAAARLMVRTYTYRVAARRHCRRKKTANVYRISPSLLFHAHSSQGSARIPIARRARATFSEFLPSFLLSRSPALFIYYETTKVPLPGRGLYRARNKPRILYKPARGWKVLGPSVN